MGGKGRKFRNASALATNHQSMAQRSSSKDQHASQHDKPHKHLQKAQYPQQTVHSKKHHSHARLPIQLKQPLRFNSPVKRSRMSATSSSGSKAKVDISGPTGLEDVVELKTELGMTKLSSLPTPASLRYQIRDKHAERELRKSQSARAKGVVKRQRQLSSVVRSNSKTTIVKQRGLRNLTGALCYRHSLFQALLHTPMFVNWLERHSWSDDCVEQQESCVACALKALNLAYRGGNGAALEEALSITNALFRKHHWRTDSGNGHGDPQEQFTFITKMLEQQVPNATYRIFQASRCLLIDSVIKCNACNHESGTRENVMGFLHVGLRPRCADGRLSSYIANNMSEKVTGYKCENCKNDADKRRSHQIAHSPDLLIVQLMRFNAGITGNVGKDNTPVSFTTSLDLNAYRSQHNNHISTYQLTAVVMHAGGSGFGHYTCSAKGGDGEWYHFDDSSVSKINVNRATNPGSGWSPYLLFYVRNND